MTTARTDGAAHPRKNYHVRDEDLDVIGAGGTLQIDGSLLTPSTATIAFDGAVTTGGGKTTANVGSAGTNVTAVEYGDGYNHVTELTLAAVALLPTIPADAEGAGAVIYTFPAGVYAGHMTHLDITAAAVGANTNAAELGCGSVIATGDISALNGTATFEDWLTGQVVADVSSPATEKSTIMTAGVPLIFEAAGSHVLNINIAGTWTATVTSMTLTGTVTIYWTFLGA